MRPARRARRRWTSCRPPRRSARATSSAPTRRGSAQQGVHAAQVLLTASDIAARTNYLNARQTLRRLIEWGVVPVVNENDTTATDEITFGDNDFLAAQVAILLDARLLVLLTDIDGLHSADPRQQPDAELIAEVSGPAQLEGLEIGDRTSAFGSGGMRSKVAAAEMAARGRDRGGDLQRHAGRDAARRPPPASRSAPRFAARRRQGLELQALAQVREAGPRPRRRRRGRGAGPARERLQPAAGRDRRRRGQLRRRRRGRGDLRRGGDRQGDRRLLLRGAAARSRG